ncbi:PaaI family thioesterase [Nocardioides sp. Bht2]|uniref:PaaI family thioesterase n=1 Tax=Nocardioides sp. Bht2 TaxID=3392297 RepID=UPI0039B36F0B
MTAISTDKTPPPPRLIDLDDAGIAAERERYAGLTEAVRELIDATVRTTVGTEELDDVAAIVRAQTARLRDAQVDGPLGVTWTSQGKRLSWGNAVVGHRNPIAPPVNFTAEADGTVWAEFTLGAAYEGPNHLIHGGVSAMILDQALGVAAEVSGAPGMTGTLTVRYRRGTPLGALRVEAKATHHEGVKTFVSGTISDADGICVEAEGVFILPAATRALYEEHAALIGYDPTSYPER